MTCAYFRCYSSVDRFANDRKNSILLRSLGLFIGQPYQLPHRTAAPSTRHLGGFVTVLALNKIMVLLRSPF